MTHITCDLTDFYRDRAEEYQRYKIEEDQLRQGEQDYEDSLHRAGLRRFSSR